MLFAKAYNICSTMLRGMQSRVEMKLTDEGHYQSIIIKCHLNSSIK